MNDLFNQDQNQGEELGEKEEEPNELATQKKERKESKETLISRLSRLSTAKGAGTKIRGNKLALNRYKQRAIEEYDCLDSNSLIQFKKIFTILNLKNSNGKITLDDLQEKCAKYKFIKTDINDIWKYLSFCVCIENVSILENKTELDINKEIVEEVDAFINQKLLNEDIDYDSDNLSEEENEDKKDNLEEITLNLVEKIMKQTIDIKENNMVLNEIKNDISALNKNDIDDYKELVNEKMKQIDEFINKNQKEVEKNINKMESVKNNIFYRFYGRHLIYSANHDGYEPEFSGNTYVQYGSHLFGAFWSKKLKSMWFVGSDYASELLDYLGDSKGKVVVSYRFPDSKI